jgi:hypothetical protein
MPIEVDVPMQHCEQTPDSIELLLRITDPEVVAELAAQPEGTARDEFTRSALRIGVLALRQAEGAIDAAAVRRESDRLLAQLARSLDLHQQTVTLQLTGALQEYFDPVGGKFSERVERLVRRDGELEQLLRRQIGGDGSELAKTLTSQLGEQSPLMRLLDPKSSGGFLETLEKVVDRTVGEQRERILREFSLDNKEGALSRLIAELVEHHGKVGRTLQDSIEEVVGEFSLDNEDSALSRLVKRVELAQRQISSEFSLDDEQSALARMRRDLLVVLEGHQQQNDRFQREVMETLAALTARREEMARSTRHGIAFETEVFLFLQKESQKIGDVAAHTGNTPGLIKHCKVGDAIIDLGPDSAAPGARIAAEAKEKAGFTLAAALQEMELARKNRGASVGLFVFSKGTAPECLQSLQRYGVDVVVVWDAEDPSTDVFLAAGLMVSRALCIRARTDQNSMFADLEGIEAALLEIERQAGGLEEISTLTGTIKSNADKVLKRTSVMREALGCEIGRLYEKLHALRRSPGELTAGPVNGSVEPDYSAATGEDQNR